MWFYVSAKNVFYSVSMIKNKSNSIDAFKVKLHEKNVLDGLENGNQFQKGNSSANAQ